MKENSERSFRKQRRRKFSFPESHGLCPEGKAIPGWGLGSGRPADSYTAPNLPAQCQLDLYPLHSEPLVSPIRGPACGSENTNYFPYPAFPTLSSEFSFCKSIQSSYHLSISSPDPTSLAANSSRAVTLGDP